MNIWTKKIGAGMLAVVSMFAVACFDDTNGNVTGGVAEETNIAQNIVLTGNIQASYNRSIDENSQAASQETVSGSATVPYIKGVKFCKLDSLTFEEGECVLGEVKGDSSYEVKANESWHYGLLVVEASDISEEEWNEYSAAEQAQDSLYNEHFYSIRSIIDVKKLSASNVNILTECKYRSVKRMLSSGTNVADAMERAEQNVLNSIGVYGDYGSFEKMNIFEETRSSAVLLAAMYLLTVPLNEKDSIKAGMDFRLGLDFAYDYVHHPAFWMSLGIEQPDGDFVDLVEKYVSNAMSVDYGIGRCTSENEGQVVSFNPNFNTTNNEWTGLKCEDNFWIWNVPGAEHNVGTMTDVRDGRTYKTTTMNVGGETQTWMTEDLKYELSGSKCRDDSLPNCERFGRLYTWAEAMQIDTMGLMSPNVEADSISLEKCIVEKLDLAETFVEDYPGYDSADAYKECAEWGINHKQVALLVDDVQNYQGICPDGWRIPSANDWMKLVENYSAKELMKTRSWHGGTIRASFKGKAKPLSGRFNTYMRTYDTVEFSAIPNKGARGLRGNEIISDGTFGTLGSYVAIPIFEGMEDSIGFFDVSFGLSGFVEGSNDYDYQTKEPVRMGVRCIKK